MLVNRHCERSVNASMYPCLGECTLEPVTGELCYMIHITTSIAHDSPQDGIPRPHAYAFCQFQELHMLSIVSRMDAGPISRRLAAAGFAPAHTRSQPSPSV